MKVFISWSGEKSNKIANILRDWMPCVIQSIKPYVSSKDIDKGARWSSDIAQELKDSRFGIICVTKDNINAPWINFEAGALSKTMDKSNVAPFLFDIKRSEVNGPISQFQSTIFDKDDIKSLMRTLNKLCGDGGISEARFNTTFEKWYPTLEKDLNYIYENESIEGPEVVSDSDIIGEILKISKENQEIIRNTDLKLDEKMDEFKNGIDNKPLKKDDNYIYKEHEIINELNFIHSILYRREIVMDIKYKCMMLLDFFKKDFPIIYDMGKDLIDDLNSDSSDKLKRSLINDFMEISDAMIRGYVFMKYYDNKAIFPLYRKGLDMLDDQYNSYIFKKEQLKTSDIAKRLLNNKQK